MENIIKGIILEVLELDESNIQELTVETNLKELGLDSLKGILLIVKIEEYFGFEIEDDDLIFSKVESINNIINLIKKYKVNI